MTVTNETTAPQQEQTVQIFDYGTRDWNRLDKVDAVDGQFKKGSWYVWLKSGRAIIIEKHPDQTVATWREVNLSER